MGFAGSFHTDLTGAQNARFVARIYGVDTDALLVQARGYGLGLGAWLTKVAVNRQHRRLAFSVLRRRARAVARA